MNIDHAAFAVLGDYYKSHLELLLSVLAKIGKPGHEDRLITSSANIPGLFLVILYRPFKPTASRNDHPTLTEHVPEVMAGEGGERGFERYLSKGGIAQKAG